MDWIKMRANLRDDPAVWTIAKTLKMDAFGVVGRLHAMWAWFDSHATANDPFVSVSPEAMDDHLRCQGWCDAVAAAGWLIIKDDRLGVPNFARHMGASAKERAMSAVRVARHRVHSANGIYRESKAATGNGHVTLAPLPESQACNANVTVGALHAKSNQDNALPCNAPTVTSPLQNRYQRRVEKRREEEREETIPPTINNPSSISIQDQEAKEALHAAWMAKLAEAQSKASKVKEAT